METADYQVVISSSEYGFIIKFVSPQTLSLIIGTQGIFIDRNTDMQTLSLIEGAVQPLDELRMVEGISFISAHTKGVAIEKKVMDNDCALLDKIRATIVAIFPEKKISFSAVDDRSRPSACSLIYPIGFELPLTVECIKICFVWGNGYLGP